MKKATQVLAERLRQVLEAFKLRSAAKLLASRLVEADSEGAVPTVLDLLEAEAKERLDRKRERLLRAAHLPPGKTFETFDRARLPRSLVQRLDTLAEGQWVEEGANVLAFGLPGVGKSHAAAALGHALVDRGYSVLFTPTFRLVQELLAAKRDLKLPGALRKLDLFDVLALDEPRLGKALAKCRYQRHRGGGRRAAENTDHRHRRLLRTHGKRPRCRDTPDKTDKLPPPHVRPQGQPRHRSDSSEAR